MIQNTLMTTGVVVLGLAPAAAASPIAIDGDAELTSKRKIRLSAETRGADRVAFLYNGKRHRARLTEIDREDGTKDWDRAVTAKSSDRQAGRVVTFRVRACMRDQCATTKFSERVEWDD